MEFLETEWVGKNQRQQIHAVDYLYLLIILILGFSLRIYKIDSPSLWIDEFVTTYKLFQADSYSEFLSIFNLYHSDQIPLSHLIYYSLSRLFSIFPGNIENLRWVSLGIAGVNIVLFYIFTILTFDRRTAIFSTFLFALSPFHILFSQMIRPYIFYELAGLCSLIATVQVLKKSSYIHGCLWVFVNIFLLTFHYTGSLLIFVEVLFLSIYFFMEKKRTLLVFPILAIGIVFCIFYFFTPRSVPIYTREDDFIMGMPHPYKWLCDLFADDAILTNEPFFHQGQKCSLISHYWMNEITGLHYWFDTLLIMFSFFSVYYIFNGLFSKWQYNCGLHTKRLSSILGFPFWAITHQPIISFLLSVVIVPIAILTLLSIFLWPCLQTRYTLYSSLALYPLIAFSLINIKDKKVRRILLIWFVIAFSYQSFISATSQKTTDFKNAGRIISQRSNPDEPILTWGIFYIGTPITNEMLAYYIETTNKEIIPVYSFSDATNYLKKNLIDKQKQGAWLVIEPYVFKFPDENVVETCFNSMGIEFEKTFLPGMNGLWIYHLYRTDSSFKKPFNIPEFIDYTPFLDILRKINAPSEIIESAKIQLKRYIDFYHPPTPMIWNYISWCALDRGEPVLGEWFAKCAIHLQPQTPWGYHSLAISLFEQNREQEALNILNECINKDPTGIHKEHFFSLIRAVYIEKDVHQAKQIIEKIEAKGGFINPIYKRRAGLLD